MRTDRERSNLLSQREYARRRGLSHQAVGKAIRSGRIPATNGKVDPQVADLAWTRNSRPRADLAPDERATGLGADPASSHDEAARDRPQATYTAARALREVYLAKQAKLDFERAQSKLVPVEEVRTQAFEAARTIRNQLLSLPTRLAPVVFGAQDVGECQRLLEDALREVCASLGTTATPPEEPTAP